MDALNEAVVSNGDSGPDCPQQLVLRDDLTRMLGQVAQDSERLRPQFD